MSFRVRRVATIARNYKTPDGAGEADRPAERGMSDKFKPWRGDRFRGPGWTWKTKTETRRIIDRTVGGDVVYQAGRRTAFSPPSIVSLDEWRRWVLNADPIS